MNRIPYASTIGSIMYVMVCTRPDVAYALSMCSRYQSSPVEAHWCAAKNILKYLRRTNDDFLVYGGDEKLFVQWYTNTNCDLIWHIVIKYNIRMCKVQTDDNITDPLTKHIHRPKHDSHAKVMGLKHIE